MHITPIHPCPAAAANSGAVTTNRPAVPASYQKIAPHHYTALRTAVSRSLALLLWLIAAQVGYSQDIPDAYDNDVKVNYIRTWEVQRPITDPAAVLSNTNPAEVLQTTQYVDGLGRPIQTVVKKGTPLHKDLVTAAVYDAFGRESQQFLPFASTSADGSFKLDPFQQQTAFYNSYLSGQDQHYFYGITEYEASPLNRVVASYGAGDSWAGTALDPPANRHGVKLYYGVNTAGDSVMAWQVSSAGADPFGSYTAGYYAAGQLHKLITTDEQGGQTLEFKDKEGKVVLKKVQLTAASDPGSGSGGHHGWLSTYYIYDDLGQLRAVLQPEGTLQSGAGNPSPALTATILKEQCFRYAYDGRGRMILKQTPGAGTTEMVYDARDRLVLQRDSSLRKQGYWETNQYDGLNRLIRNALWYNSQSRSYHQGQATGSTTYPGAVGDPLQQNYYDNYDWISGSTLSATLFTADYWSAFFIMNFNVAPEYAQPLVADFTNTRGRLTGTRVRLLGTSTFLHTANFYDDKGRLIQTQAENLSGGKDRVTTQYDFAGRPLRVLNRQDKNGIYARFMRELTSYSYDHMGRVTMVKKKMGSSAANERTIATHTYDELGRLKTKVLGDGLETQQFDYNVRGWTLGVNRNYIKGQGPDRWFGYELGYDNPDAIVSPGQYTASFTGNIGGMLWRSAGDGQKRKYQFSYDKAHRLMKAEFSQHSGSAFDNSAGIDFSAVMGDGINPGSAYDGNGNIRKMQQKGWKGTSSPLIDDLDYLYQPGSNKLAKVTDAQSDPNTTLGDFKDGTNWGDDYAYDGNGNLTKDNNRGATSIFYTHKNQPYEVNIPGKGRITYAYDNLGRRLKKTILDQTTSPATTTTWMYLNNFVYRNDTLQYLLFEEGTARYDTSEGTGEAKAFHFDYFVKDHLGNVRMVLTEEKQRDLYEPLSFEGSSGSAQQQAQDALWENSSGGSIDIVATRISRPGGFGDNSANGSYVQLVRKSTGAIGAAKLLKVMKGDSIYAAVEAYYNTANTNNSGASGITSLVANLASALLASGQVSPLLKDNAAALTTGVAGDGALASLLNTPASTSGGNQAPKAYLNIVFFDEQLRPDTDACRVVPVAYNATTKQALMGATEVQKSGYVYVYVSNESNTMVYFDNFMLTHVAGSLKEETHYYPFGLTMAGISSKALGKMENKCGFNKGSELQNKEFSDGVGLEMYATQFRMLDPQIGRWWQIDPKPDMAMSPYSSMNNNPIRFNDPLGDTIRVDQSITGNKTLHGAFNQFASTKAGIKFLSKYAAKGQTIAGHTYKKEGKYSKGGADINYSAKSIKSGASGETTGAIDNNGRGQVNVSLNSDIFNSEKTSLKLVAEGSGSFFHESFIHGDLRGQDFMDNKKFDFSNISDEVKKAAGGMENHYHHYKVLLDVNSKGYNNNNLWPSAALDGIREVNSGLGIKQTDQEINKEMWNYRGGIILE